jgi:fatty acid desaturase
LNDFPALYGWLNYQIKHHVWPDMTMLQYRKAQPKLQAICDKHGVRYLQASTGSRLAKLTGVMVDDEVSPVLHLKDASRLAS